MLVAGPSGSGKSRLCRVGAGDGIVASVPLDDFYRDHDHPGLPRTLGIVDWDDVASFDVEGAVTALTALLRDGVADVPVYDISRSQRTGVRRLDVSRSRVLVAEGIFATQVLGAVQAAGLPVEAIWLDRSPPANFLRRLGRDLRERRKAPAILVRRGLVLYRSEPALRRSALVAGFRAMGMKPALAHLSRLTGSVDGAPRDRAQPEAG